MRSAAHGAPRRVTLRNLTTKAAVKLHDRHMQHSLHREEAGLTLLAYALGAASSIVPLALLFSGSGIKAIDYAESEALHAVGNACTTSASDPNPFCP